MVNAIKFNKDIHKLSKNEMKIYHELQKFLNKEQDINVLIGSYLSGNNSKKLYNKISSMLYNKLTNGIINKKEYTNLGFEKNIFEKVYHRSTKTPNLDKTKFLKIYCNLVDNKEDNMFLSNIFIKNNIGEQIIYENHNSYKRKRILDTLFNYIEVCIKN